MIVYKPSQDLYQQVRQYDPKLYQALVNFDNLLRDISKAVNDLITLEETGP